MSIEKDIEIIKGAVQRNMNGMVLNIVLDWGSKYIIGIDFADNNKGELMDPYYLVDKKTYNIAGFSPMMNMKKFKEASKKPLYTRNKE